MTDIATTYPNYVPTANLTNAYIQSLIARVGWTDVTAQHPDWGFMYIIQDLDGGLNGFGDMTSARTALINAYTLMTNS